MAATPEHMAALTAIYYPLCRPTYHAMTGLECKEVKHRDYDAEVVLMINPQGKPLHWLLYWQAHYRACPLR
jgi:hypothetical protein